MTAWTVVHILELLPIVRLSCRWCKSYLPLEHGNVYAGGTYYVISVAVGVIVMLGVRGLENVWCIWLNLYVHNGL